MLMRSFKGKSLLSLVRNEDYAHAGEQEAIIKVFSGLKKNSKRKILDVGCGIGGTAKFIYDHGWGMVTGVDIEPESMGFIKKHYPEIDVYCCDVVDIPLVIKEQFDLICLFNSFYAFTDQKAALQAMRAVAHNKTQLIIFDYIDLTHGTSHIIIGNDKTEITNPIETTNFKKMCAETSWSLDVFEDLHTEYQNWYQELLKKINKSQKQIIEYFGDAGFQNAINRYTDLYNAIESHQLSGGILRCSTLPKPN